MAKLAAVIQQLKKEQIRLSSQLKGVAAALAAFGAAYGKRTGPRKISAAGRARIAAAQRARWAKVRGEGKLRISGNRKQRASNAATYKSRRSTFNPTSKK